MAWSRSGWIALCAHISHRRRRRRRRRSRAAAAAAAAAKQGLQLSSLVLAMTDQRLGGERQGGCRMMVACFSVSDTGRSRRPPLNNVCGGGDYSLYDGSSQLAGLERYTARWHF